MAYVFFLSSIARTLGSGSSQGFVETRSEVDPFSCRGLASLLLAFNSSAFVAISPLRRVAEGLAISGLHYLRHHSPPMRLGEKEGDDGSPDNDAVADHERVSYDWDSGTHLNYGESEPVDFVGRFVEIRKTLDYEYHYYYPHFRQRTQDSIINEILSTDRLPCTERPWIVFTAGAMGAGKSYVMKSLSLANLFSLDGCVSVDMDDIREKLPEWETYVLNDQECLQSGDVCLIQTAGDFTQLESGYIQEILLEAALTAGMHVVVDGSMHNENWWTEEIRRLRKCYPNRRFALLEIFTPLEEVKRNVEERYNKTGRMVPEDLVVETFAAVPRFVRNMSESKYIDACFRLDNVRGAALPRLRDSSGKLIADMDEPRTSLAWQAWAEFWRIEPN